MDAMTCIMTRRSVRRYLNKVVDEAVIAEVIKAGAAAPSAANQQPWHFLLITERELLIKIADNHPYGKMLKEAAFAVLICHKEPAASYPELVYDDCGAATQNMLLAAHALGLGAVWIGIHHSKERMDFLRGLFDIPADYSPFSLIACGHTDEKGRDAGRFKSGMLHTNKW